jgi:hypothetical protein
MQPPAVPGCVPGPRVTGILAPIGVTASRLPMDPALVLFAFIDTPRAVGVPAVPALGRRPARGHGHVRRLGAARHA